MFNSKVFRVLLIFLAIMFGSGADAHYRGGLYFSHYHSHPRFGFYLGFPWYPRTYYPYYPYYPPQIVTVPVEPPVYIERSKPQSDQQFPAGYWYYCGDPEGYYPYVKECPAGWTQVSPVPPSTK